jgi:hypothetical protein
VASHLGLFDEVIGSDGTTNLSAERKAAMLVDRYGDHGFDYAATRTRTSRCGATRVARSSSPRRRVSARRRASASMST